MTKVTIPITEEQWQHIQELMKKHNASQEEIVTFLMTVGMREKNFREENK
jgi:hypothetical protein